MRRFITILPPFLKSTPTADSSFKFHKLMSSSIPFAVLPKALTRSGDFSGIQAFVFLPGIVALQDVIAI